VTQRNENNTICAKNTEELLERVIPPQNRLAALATWAACPRIPVLLDTPIRPLPALVLLKLALAALLDEPALLHPRRRNIRYVMENTRPRLPRTMVAPTPSWARPMAFKIPLKFFARPFKKRRAKSCPPICKNQGNPQHLARLCLLARGVCHRRPPPRDKPELAPPLRRTET